MKKNLWKKLMAVMLAGVMTTGLAACGNGESGTGGSGGNDKDAAGSDSTFVWVPSYVSIPQDEDSYTGDITVVGNKMYYTYYTYSEEASTTDFRYLDLENPGAEPVVVMEQPEGETGEEFSEYLSRMFATPEGNVVAVWQRQPVYSGDYDWEKQQRETTYSMRLYSKEGTELFNVDITACLQMDPDNSYLRYALSDESGNIYLSNGNNYVWVFDKEGNHISDIKIQSDSQYSYINAMGILPDGRIAIAQDGSQDMEIKAYNEQTKSFSDTYKNLPPNCWNTDIGSGISGGVLLQGSEALYEYDLGTQTYTEILNWIDCDMNPDYIEFVSAMSEDCIAAYTRDWNTNENSLVLLKKTPASEVVQKETLTFGCMSLSQSIQSAIVEFNKNNEQYRIEVKDYTASIDWSAGDGMTAYEDAVTRFNNDIITGNAPDLFATDSLNIDLLAAKGVIADLNTYLESSTTVSRADLFESVLNAYTKSDILCAIPVSFTVSTLVGRTAEVGEEPGWTIDEMIALAEQYPDAELFSYATNQTVLQYAMMFDEASYVNWETGECYFDTPEFVKILELAAKYSDEADYETSEPKRLGNHETLLSMASFSEAYEWQLQEMMFGEPVTAIGFPSANSTGVLVNGQDSICISAASQNKDAAWSFIEGLLTEEEQSNDFMRWGFPIRRSAYDAVIEEAMKPNYRYDENGEVMLDENGEPMEYSNMSYGWDDVTFELYSAKQDEVDRITKLIESVGGIMNYDLQWMSIVEEETGAFFAGQKTAEEVAEIIQSRVQIYVNESR